MHGIEKQLDAWPESADELLALIQRFDQLQKKHCMEYVLSMSIFWVATSRAEIDALLNADDKLVAAGKLLGAKLDFWS